MLHPFMPFVSEEIYGALVPEEESLMMSKWPEFKAEWNFATEELQVERMKEIIRGVRNVRAEMNVAPSRKAGVFVVCENEVLCNGFAEMKTSAAPLMSASEIVIQNTKEGIEEDAVSVVVTDAVVYLPLAELVDFEQEIERLTKEEERLKKELARVNGMLSNEKFISKAPEAKINEEKAKLEKYTQMMEQVQERLAGLRK
jgi:valyl-tRNA synthetase